ncbi:hypothetical protein ACGFYQ_33715 [Streptomyces sp. NPDC048258]|uniref:hypothetical protein n=1 Tax=Streptomyces sp. NPDC048258 TaxID=3365527 RepID=UPI00371B9E48
MKKRAGRPARFTMIANTAIDDESLDMTELGLHTFLVRCKDGYDIDMDTLAKRRGPGRRALYSAMRKLVERGYVIKVKFQDKGGLWATEVVIYDTPAELHEVEELLQEFAHCKNVRLEPLWLDPRKQEKEPPAETEELEGEEKPSSAPTDRNRQAGEVGPDSPACQNRQAGNRQVGDRQVVNRQAKDRKTDTETDTKTVHPSVGSSQAGPGLDDGGRDGQQIGTRERAQARTIERTPGVGLLLGLGYERPEMLLTGKVLADQALVVDGLLLDGWTKDHVLTALLRPLPPQTRSVGAVISRRLTDMAASPVPAPIAMPGPRNPQGSDWERYEEGKRHGTWTPDPWDGQDVDAFVNSRQRWADCQECKDPIITPTGTDRCGNCLGWAHCPLCSKLVPPGTHCVTCEQDTLALEFAVCEEHGDRFVAGTACFQCQGE